MSATIDFYPNLQQRLVDVQNPDKDTRQNAEGEIRSMRDENPTKFVASLVKEIADDANSEATRQMACVLCKNTINKRQVDPKYADLWVNFDGTFKQQVKDAVIASLTSESAKVRSSIASLISTIAQIEIPRGEWTDLIGNLCGNANHDNLQIRLTSLQTIGYICEEMEPRDLTQELKNQIMLALTQNISDAADKSEPCKLAIKALLHSIPYTTANFEVDQERDFIMTKVFEALRSPEVSIRETAMQCLVTIGQQEYNHMQPYINQIVELTRQVAFNDDMRVGTQAIEFWTTLAEVELARVEKNGQIHGFTSTYKGFLIELLLQGISNVQIEDEDDAEEEWGVNMASGCCLVKVSALLKNEVFDPVVQFVTANIRAPEWQKRYSALVAFGAIADGPDKQKFAEILVPSSYELFNMFGDKSIKVREAISWVAHQICTHHAEVMMNTPHNNEFFINVLLQALPDKPKVSVYVCMAIEKLSESLAPVDKNVAENQLTIYFERIAQALFNNASRTDEEDVQLQILQASYSSLTMLCQHSCSNSDEHLRQMLMMILQQLEATTTQPVSKRVNEVQPFLCGLLQVIMTRVGSLVPPETCQQIVQLIINSFQQHQQVTEHGLIAYMGCCIGLKEKVPINDIGQYIFEALKQEEDEAVTRVAVGIVIDISDGLQEAVDQYLSSFIPQLLNILRNPRRKQDTKLAAINALASVSCYAAQAFCQYYLTESLTLLQQAAQISVAVAEFQDDQDTIEYLSELRYALIEAYSQITLCVSDCNAQAQYLPYVAKVFEFLQQAAMLDRSQESCKQVVGLLGDLAGCLRAEVAPFLQAPWVNQVLNTVKSFRDIDSIELAKWAVDQVMTACAAQQKQQTSQ